MVKITINGTSQTCFHPNSKFKKISSMLLTLAKRPYANTLLDSQWHSKVVKTNIFLGFSATSPFSVKNSDMFCCLFQRFFYISIKPLLQMESKK